MFLKQRDADAIELTLSLSQLKKMYVALFRQLRGRGFAEFDEMDEDDMLLTLQTYLQRRAIEAGVDVADHSAWEAFLGVNGGACSARAANRDREI